MTKMRDVAVPALILCMPLLAAFVYLAPDTAAYAAGAPDGKQVFLSQKCDLCHAVPAAGIAATTQSMKMKGPDLDGLAARHDATWTKKYLAKQEAIGDKKHPKELKASDAEGEALVAWLLAQKK